MGRRRLRSAVLALSAVLTAIAATDSIREEAWDLVPVLAVALVMQLSLLVGPGRTRRDVAVRADLFHWLAQRAAACGEDLDRVADRCVAAYRAGITVEPPEASPGHRAAVPQVRS